MAFRITKELEKFVKKGEVTPDAVDEFCEYLEKEMGTQPVVVIQEGAVAANAKVENSNLPADIKKSIGERKTKKPAPAKRARHVSSLRG